VVDPDPFSDKDLLDEINGRAVTLNRGKVTIQTAHATVEKMEMSRH
jgi:membrane-bound ClpP family serine protease